MTIWRLTTHPEHPEAALAWVKEHKRIALGWGEVGDISRFGSADEISVALKALKPPLSNTAPGGANLWDFAHTVQKGDYVIVGTTKLRVVVAVTGEYEWKSQPDDLLGDYQHQRVARASPYSPDKLWRLAGAKPAAGYSPRWALIRGLNDVDADDL